MTARPGPSIFKGIGRSPAQPIAFYFQQFTARPIRFANMPARPGHDIGGEAHETRALYGLARPFCGPAPVLSRTKR